MNEPHKQHEQMPGVMTPGAGTSRDDLAPSEAERLLEELRRDFDVFDKDFYWRGENKKLAFTDAGSAISTHVAHPEAARGMAKLAKAKGWMSVHLAGTQAFRRTAWLEASLLGLAVEGYRPDAYDQAELQRRLDLARADAARTAAPMNRTGPREAPRSRSEDPVSQALRQTLAVSQLDPQRTEATLRLAAGLVHDGRAHVGTLLSHGTAPFRFDPANPDNYFVTLQTVKGEQTVWGIDLLRNMQAPDAPEIGQSVLVAFQGEQAIKLPDPDRPGQWTTGRRNAWLVRTVEQLVGLAAGPHADAPGPRAHDLDILQSALAGSGAPPAVQDEVLRTLARDLSPSLQPRSTPSVPLSPGPSPAP